MLASNALLQQLANIPIPEYPSVTGLHQAITARSLAWFFYALVWAWVLLLSFVGWGRATGKLLRTQRLPASVSCCLGIAIIIFLGGILNLLHAIYSQVIFSLVAIGGILYLFLRKERPEKYRWRDFWKKTSPVARLLLIATLVILCLRIAGTVRLGKANSLDDGPAYLAFPHKMLEVHSFASDPFSERRVTSSLGGGYFLQSFIVSATSLANIAMADRTLGLILLGGMLFDLGILFELSTLQIAWMELLAFLVPQEAMNLTFVILPVPILLGMTWMTWQAIEDGDLYPSKYAVLAGAMGGAAITLKSTYLPCVAAFIFLPYLLLFVRRKKKLAIQSIVIAGLGAFITLFAWMLAMKWASGTYLFPVFGHGIDYSGYGLFQTVQKSHSVRRLVKIFLQSGILLVLAGILLLTESHRRGGVRFRDKRALFSVAISFAAAIAILALNYKSGGDSIWRYNFPQFFTAVLIYFIVAASILRTHVQSGTKSRMAHLAFSIGIVSLIAMVFYYDVAGKNPRPFRQVRMEWGDYKPSLRASLSGSQLESPKIQAEYRAVEDSLPPHEVALENVPYPFLFNYQAHRIFIADWPGAASPAPGWRFRDSNSAFSDYLRRHSIRYIVYDYHYGRWMDMEGCKALENPNLNSEWLQEQWWLTILTHNQFDHLRARYRSTYDDGNIVVIDLEQPIPGTSNDEPVWTLDTDKDVMCAKVTSQYLKNPLSE